MGKGAHSNGQPQIAQADLDGDPREPRPAWKGPQGERVDGLRGRRPSVVRDRGWGGMKNCGIRSRQVVGSGAGGKPDVYGHMEEGGGESS